MQLHQLLRMLDPENAVVIMDLQGQIMYKELSKENIPVDLYEEKVLRFGSAVSEFYNIKSCIYFVIEK